MSDVQIGDVRKNVVELWADASASWQDDLSKKYKAAMIDQMEDILDSMQNSCDQLMRASGDALKRLKEIQE